MSDRFYLTGTDVKQLRHLNRTVTELVDAPPNVNRRRDQAAPGQTCWHYKISMDEEGTTIAFPDARISFMGKVTTDYQSIYLPAAAVAHETVYLYLAVTRFNDYVTTQLFWSSARIGNVYNTFEFYQPIRYIGTVTIADGAVTLTGTPTDTVCLPGLPSDRVLLYALTHSYPAWDVDLSDAIEPGLLVRVQACIPAATPGINRYDMMTVSAAFADLNYAGPGKALIYMTIRNRVGELHDIYYDWSNPNNYGTGTSSDLTATVVIGIFDSPDPIGFRQPLTDSIEPTAPIASRNWEWAWGTGGVWGLNLIQPVLVTCYRGAWPSAIRLTIPSASVQQAHGDVKLHIYYNYDTGVLDRIGMSAGSFSVNLPDSTSGLIDRSRVVGNVSIPSLGGDVLPVMYYPILTIPYLLDDYALSRIADLESRTGALETSVADLQRRVTALEQRN